MAYSFQTFSYAQVLTSAQMNQVEENILKHEHGVTANCTTLSLYVAKANNETITGVWTHSGTSGTPSYANKLFRIEQSGGSGAGISFGGTLNNYQWVQAQDTNPNSKDLVLQPLGGNVGIGTVSPTARVSVVVSDGEGTATPFVGKFTHNDVTSGESNGVIVYAGATTSDTTFEACSRSGSTYLKVLGDGKVGIRVSPAYPLHVQVSYAGVLSYFYQTNVSGEGILIQGSTDTNPSLRIDNSVGTTKLRLYGNGQIESLLATGTSPIVVASTTACTNLNADMVDGEHSDGIQNIMVVHKTTIGTFGVLYLNGQTVDATESNVYYSIPTNRTAKNLRVHVHTNTMSWATTFTLQKNGTATALTCSIAANTTGAASDNVHTASFTQGDYYTLKVDTSGSVSGSITFMVSWLM